MRRAALAFTFLLLAATARAQETTPANPPAPAAVPIIRTTLDPKEGAVVGQHIALYVDVMFPGDMPRPPRVAIPDMPGAQVMRFETQATTMRETIDGADYVGQRFEFAVFPRRSGPLAIPPAAVTLLDRDGDVTGTQTGQSVQETIVAPEGIDAKDVVVATDTLTLEQSWKPEPGTALHVGDALVRTITRTATDVPALAMRDLAFPAPDGVRVYVDAPASQDQSNRGTITGKRIDRVTYVFEKAGTFDLPAVDQPWWNLADKQAETATGKGATATVKAGPAPTTMPGTPAASTPVRPLIWATIAALAILVVLALATVWKWRAQAPHRRAEQALSEPAAFHALTHAGDSGDAAAIYKALATWRARLPACWPAPPDASALEMALFAGGPAWTKAMAKTYLMSLRQYRAAALARPRDSAPAPLPPLNPLGKPSNEFAPS
ncbi:hypothetical protein [Kaistia terrae]|uniref:Protein BatD n=1 Tax=Kaistia terrae TaxID=537017 RepID=A0ABW0Q1J2_9HYPH|nr:hypothetical protein [Kaistia terrae]MCX5578586.1 hypothetical protein [Kaistia terrae]